MTDLLVVEDLVVSFGRVVAVNGVDIRIAAGEMVAMLGPNGVGKSSILTALAGVVPATRGRMALDGRDLFGWSAHRTAAHGIRLVPEGRALFPDMTVRDNLAVGSPRGRMTPDSLERIFDVFPVLEQRGLQQAGTLSGGEQQQLAIARALIGEPRLLLLDEPSMGLAPRVVVDIMRALRTLAGTGLAILLAEQNANAVLGTVDKALLLKRGRIIDAGTPDHMRQTLKGGYLGTQA